MIEIKNVIKKYNENKHNECVAVKGVSLTIEDGELVAIMGKSGSGKSTLLHMIAGIDVVTEGSILINNINICDMKDKDISEFRNKNIGIVLQQFFLINECSVLDNVLVPLNFTNVKSKTRMERATTIICQVDMEKYLKKSVAQLFGGEKQRVAIARALINEPSIILADEPTGSLDEENSLNIIEMLLRINRNLKKTVVLITHDRDIANRCDRIITITNGVVASDILTSAHQKNAMNEP